MRRTRFLQSLFVLQTRIVPPLKKVCLQKNFHQFSCFKKNQLQLKTVKGGDSSFGSVSASLKKNRAVSPIDYTSKPWYRTGLVVGGLREGIEAIFRPAKISTLVPIFIVRAGEYVIEFQVQA